MCTADMLDELGFDVIEAASGEEAMDIFAAEPVDLLITDFYMDGINGVELADIVLAASRGTKIIIASARSDLVTAEPGILWLEKPFTFDNLASVIRASGLCKQDDQP